MAASSVLTGTTTIWVHGATKPETQRRRRVSSQAERALKMIGHAIEYISDDYIYDGGQFQLADARVQAMLLLMNRRQEIYASCPESSGLGGRLWHWLGFSEKG